MKVKCCVQKCITNELKNSIPTFPFPKMTYNKMNQNQPNLVALRRIKMWAQACGLSENYDPESHEDRVCCRHFVKGKPAKKMEMKDVDWVPTLNLNGEFDPEELVYSVKGSPEKESLESCDNIIEVSGDATNQSNDVCTMIYDEKTGDLVIVNTEKEVPKVVKLESKSPMPKRKSDTKLSLNEKKPRILNRDAPKDDEELVEEVPIETTIVTNDQSCQTDLTSERLEELEKFWTENYQPARKSTRNKKQVKS